MAHLMRLHVLNVVVNSGKRRWALAI
jgi:hypothetical protein